MSYTVVGNASFKIAAASFMLACGAAFGLGGVAVDATPGAPAAPASFVVAPASEAIGTGIVRFYASEKARASALPSMALKEPRKPTGAAPAGFATTVEFSNPKGGGCDARVKIAAGTSLYATGEVAGPLLRNGRKIVCWNTDAYGYGDDAPSLYKSHPWVLGVRADGTSFGVLADSTYRMTVDLTNAGPGGREFTFSTPGPDFPVIVIERATPQEVVMALGELVGTIELPPKWALGYHQCRYSYFPDSRVMEIASGFRSRKIPCDVIWHDIDYMHNFLCFTFSPKHFPDPKRHNADLHKLGFHTVWMIDPGIGTDQSKFIDGKYSVLDSGSAGDHWVKKSDGSVYKGEVWPGWCVFPDFTRQETRQWWSGLYKDFMAAGVDGVWNDMNEPAIFNTVDKSKTMPEDNIHRPDKAFAAPDGANPGQHARWHNVYGMLMVKATREGILAANPDKRPFVLSRASYIGAHRYGAAWTGDNSADWYHMESSVPMVLNMGLSGQPFVGPDIGGFAGNGPAGQEGKLFARWMGFGALLPFSRAHTATGNIDKEPWSFGPEVEKTCKLAIERRYQLMPYIYTLFRDASVTGMPVARPLFFIDPKDPALRSEDDAFLLGDILVMPRMMPDGSRKVALPKPKAGERWAPFALESEKNADLPDLALRPGAIVPTGPIMQFVDEKPLDKLTLLVNLDGAGQASGTLYEDAGNGFGYRSGDYLLTTYKAAKQGSTVTVTVASADGKRARTKRPVEVRLLGAGPNGTAAVGQGNDGDPIKIELK